MIMFTPATPIVRAALNPKQRHDNGPWQETIDLVNSYLWGCFVALGGDMVMVDAGWLHPVENLGEECGLLIRKANNWSKAGGGLINPTAARFSLVHTYRLLLHFQFVKVPMVINERAVLDLEDLIKI